MCTETRALWTGVKTIQDMPGQSRGVQQPCLLHTMLGSSFGPSTWLFPQCFIWIELKAFLSWIPSAKHSVQSSFKKKKGLELNRSFLLRQVLFSWVRTTCAALGLVSLLLTLAHETLRCSRFTIIEMSVRNCAYPYLLNYIISMTFYPVTAPPVVYIHQLPVLLCQTHI